MVTWDDVRAAALGLPEVGERPARNWRVRERSFVFERPLRRADLEHLGASAPAEVPLGVWVPDLGVKEALLADGRGTFLTTPHFDGYAIVLARLEGLEPDELVELTTEAWLCRAGRTLAARWLAEHPLPGGG